MSDLLKERLDELRREMPDISEELLRGHGLFPLSDAVGYVTRQRCSSVFDTLCEVSPFIASRFLGLDDRSFVYDGRKYNFVGSWSEDSGLPVTLMFKTEPA